MTGTPSGWEERDGALVRAWRLADFAAALALANAVGAAADAASHHPELLVAWGRLEVRWTTHSAGNAVTARDVELARVTDGLAAAAGARPGG